jgi:hypothetical protein
VAKDPRVVVSTLMKLAGGSAKLSAELSVDAFLAQARAYDDVTASSLVRALPHARAESGPVLSLHHFFSIFVLPAAFGG